MNGKTEHREVPFAHPVLGDEEIAAVSKVLRSGWLTTGGETLAFENEFAEYVHSPHALAVNSATAGLHLALEATGTGPGDVVIVPSLTFTATAEVARYLGAEVVFADVTENGLVIDADDVQRRAAEVTEAGRRLSAIIPVHLAGEVVPMEPLRRIAERHGAALIEDAAHAFPSKTAAGFAGTLADVGVYSFYANKTITTGEGGMVVTSSPTIADRVRTMRLHGIDREAWDRYRKPGSSWQYQVVAPGYKYNMTDIAAAIGRVQLRKAEQFLTARRAIAARYRTAFSDLDPAGDVVLPIDSPGHAWHLFIVRLNPDRHDRNAVARALQAAGIGVSVHYTPLHRMEYWSKRYPAQTTTLPRTDSRFAEILSLPIFLTLTPEQQDYVVNTVRTVLTTSGAFR
jgi:dTDP-4-amino-4,6-dideoxygalactose transaminase